jgi:hypothetical protein
MNNQQRAAMQMALDALEAWKQCCEPKDWPGDDEAAITALREALEVSSGGTESSCGGMAQPQGEWVEIIDDDVLSVMRHTSPATHPQLFARAIIAKFKEKNTPPVMPQSDFAAKIIAKALHYPECWDTAAYPTLDDAVIEAEAWDCHGCSVCKPQNHSGEATDMVQGDWVDLTDDELMEVLCEMAASNVVNDSVFAKAVIAKFKEKNTPKVVPQGEPVAIAYDEDVYWHIPHKGKSLLYTTPPSVEIPKLGRAGSFGD